MSFSFFSLISSSCRKGNFFVASLVIRVAPVVSAKVIATAAATDVAAAAAATAAAAVSDLALSNQSCSVQPMRLKYFTVLFVIALYEIEWHWTIKEILS